MNDTNSMLIFFIAFLALMYFMTIRPQNKKMKALQEMMNGLEKVTRLLQLAVSSGELKILKVTMFLLRSAKILRLNFKRQQFLMSCLKAQ